MTEIVESAEVELKLESSWLMIVKTLYENVPLLIDAALQLMIGLVQGLIEAIPVLVEMIPQIVISMVAALIAEVGVLLQARVEVDECLARAAQFSVGLQQLVWMLNPLDGVPVVRYVRQLACLVLAQPLSG